MKRLENLQAEKHFLAAIMKEHALIKETGITKEYFSELSHQVLFNAMQEIDKQGEIIDNVSIYTKIGNSGIFQMGGSNILNDLSSMIVNINNFKQYEKYIIEAWQFSEARNITKKFGNETNDISEKDKLTKLIQALSEIEQKGTQEQEFNLKETLVEMYDEAETEKKGMSGLGTGFKELDRMTDGNQKGDLIIVAARPSVGKTAYALNIASNHCEKGAICHLYSLEMKSKRLLNRMIACLGNIDAGKLRNPVATFNDGDWSKYTKALGILNNMDLFIYDRSNQNVKDIYATSKKLVRKFPNRDHVIIIDYMQLLSSATRKNNRNEEVSEISRALKIMAGDLNCPVIALSQLSRGVEQRQDKRPMLSDLRDSGSIEQDADRVEFLYRDDYYDKESEANNIIEIIVAKQRNGPVGTVELAFIKEYNKFINLDRKHDS